MPDESAYARLSAAVVAGDREKVLAAVEVALDAGLSPLEVIENGLSPGMREIGERFARYEVFLPGLMLAAEAWERAMAVAGFVGRKIVPGDYVWGGIKGKPLRPQSLSRAFARVAREAEASNAPFHGLRHLHATELLRAGIHPWVVQERLGHGDITVTLNAYSHVVPGLQQRAAEAFDEAFAFAMPEPRKRPALAAT